VGFTAFGGPLRTVDRGLRALNAGPVQRALKKRFGDVEVLPGERVFFSIVHAPGQGEGQGGIILHLLGPHAVLSEI
jgi:hypothetical protein